MSTLDAALAWAARGFRVFPLAAGTKNQPLFDGWTQLASTDPATIRAWWTDALGLGVAEHNVGVLTTGMVVLDIDTRKGGLDSFLAGGGAFDTLMVRTPSGGFHAYYRGPDSANGVEGWADGLDIRSHNGYVLAPGSTRPDGQYDIEIDAPLADVPDWIAQHLKPPMERSAEQAPLIELDGLVAVEQATEYLGRCPPAIEGQGGDNTTYQVACRVRAFGLSEDMTFALMLDLWNERCAPPWDADELKTKVSNAYQYATGQIGQDNPEVHFGNVVIPEPPAAPELPLPVGGFGNALDILSIPRREWIIARLLLRRYVTTLVAPGGAAKSTMLLIIAAHLALGLDFAGFKLKQGKSVIYNGEDDLEEQSRRLHAICTWYNFDFNEVRKHICLLDGHETPLTLVREEGGRPKLNVEHVQRICQLCAAEDVVMLGIDPLVEVHECDENDNTAMKYVMSVMRLIAAKSNVGLIIPHHTGKGRARAGEADAGRGATSVVNAARISLTLVPADESDCEKYGIDEEDRYQYVRMDDAKMNMSLQRGKPTWFQKHGVQLANGDEVGVVAPADLDHNAFLVTKAMAATLAAHMRAESTAMVPIAEAVTALMAADPLYGKMSIPAVRARVLNNLRRPVDANGDLVQLAKDGNKQVVVLH